MNATSLARTGFRSTQSCEPIASIAIGCFRHQRVFRLPELMGHPLISIIVNVFNGEPYVGECLDSICRLQGGFPLQVIVVDDASTDGTIKILRGYGDAGFEI